MTHSIAGRKRGPAARLLSAALLAAALPLSSASATPDKHAEIDYLNAPFRQERLLDWGNRPDWSHYGRKLVFTKDDLHDGPAYEIDVVTRKVRCLTCALGKNQFVTRIFYLPDDSYLIEASPNMESGSGGSHGAMGTQLFWMSKMLGKPTALGTGAMGDIAIASVANADGSFNISWARPNNDGLQLVMAKLHHDGHTARLADIRGLYDYRLGQPGEPSFPEAYEFMDDSKSVLFWTVEMKTLNGEMYKVDIATGEVSRVYATPSHNETHLFPDERYGLEESNSHSDPDGPYRGVSALSRGTVEMFLKMRGEKDAATLAAANSEVGFDIFVITMDGTSRRALTNVSASGAQAHQSVVSPDGRRIAFAIKDPTGKSGHAAGLYIGTFGAK